MKQAVLTAPRRFESREAVLPEPRDDEVLVRVEACGVCASELHAWQAGADGMPLVLGHEVAGEVVGVGSRVRTFAPGDRVTGLFHSGFADHAITTEDRVAAVPPQLRLEHAFGEPLACAMSAAARTRVELGDRIAFVGLGFMGLLTLQLLRLKGPARIVGIDMREDALAAGRRFGADETMRPGDVGDDLRAVLPRTGGGRGFDVVVEATGTEAGLTLAAELAREHGVLSILGYHQGPRRVDMKLWNFKALDVLNAHERRNGYRMECMKRGLALAAAGRIDLSSLATHSFGLDRVGAAFGALETKPAGFIKAIVVPGGGC